MRALQKSDRRNVTILEAMSFVHEKRNAQRPL